MNLEHMFAINYNTAVKTNNLEPHNLHISVDINITKHFKIKLQYNMKRYF